MKKILIADVHGCYDTLIELMKQFPDDAEVIFLGDLVDRGPKSPEVVEFVKSNGYKCVIGNHEQMMIEGLEEFSQGIMTNMYPGWIYNGGDKTSDSYVGRSKMREEHIEWFKSLPLYLTFEYEEHKNLLVSHAPSIDYFERLHQYLAELKKPWGEIPEFDRSVLNAEVDNMFNLMTWSRKIPSIVETEFFGISGHNVWNRKPEACSQTGCVFGENFASIDTGVCFPDEPFGTLTAIEYPSMKIYQQKLIDEIEPPEPQPRRTHAW